MSAAVELVQVRLPGQQWAGAAAMRLSDGSMVTSTAPSVPNPAVETCHETGAFCEAHKLNQEVRDSVCVIRSDQGGRFWILTPCGVCQERLFAYGPAIQVGVPHPENRGDPCDWTKCSRTGGPKCSPATRRMPDQLRRTTCPSASSTNRVMSVAVRRSFYGHRDWLQKRPVSDGLSGRGASSSRVQRTPVESRALSLSRRC